MPIDPEDPRLTAYALGELEDDEKADLEHDLSESDEGRRVVEEVRDTARLLSETLAEEVAPGLNPTHWKTIEQEIPAPIPFGPQPSWAWRRWAGYGIAASLLLGFGASAGWLAHDTIRKPRTDGPLAMGPPAPKAAPVPPAQASLWPERDVELKHGEAENFAMQVPPAGVEASKLGRGESLVARAAGEPANRGLKDADAPATPSRATGLQFGVPPSNASQVEHSRKSDKFDAAKPAEVAGKLSESDALAPPAPAAAQAPARGGDYPKLGTLSASGVMPATAFDGSKPGDPASAKPGDPNSAKPGDLASAKPGDPNSGRPGVEPVGPAGTVSLGVSRVRFYEQQGGQNLAKQKAPAARFKSGLPATQQSVDFVVPRSVGGIGLGDALLAGGRDRGNMLGDMPALNQSRGRRATLPRGLTVQENLVEKQEAKKYAVSAFARIQAITKNGEPSPKEVQLAEKEVASAGRQVALTQQAQDAKPGLPEVQMLAKGDDDVRREKKDGNAIVDRKPEELGLQVVAPVVAAPPNEDYNKVVDNDFKPAAVEPLSTFSIDVDTASYANIRRFLMQDNRRPPPDAVRIEEMVNYFPYDYPAPANDKPDAPPFSVNVEIARCPWNAENRLAKIGLKGKVDVKKAVANLVFLVDVSGSMDEPNKLPLVQASLRMLVEQLGENDRVSIVVYAGAAGLVLDSTSGLHKREIASGIDQLRAGGSTAGGAGINLAYDIAKKHFVNGGVNRVILCTDGDFNVGVSDDKALQALITEKAKSGVFLTVLGYGAGNLKDGKMEQLADKGNGNCHYIDSLMEARKVLVEQMGGTLVTVGKDVKIQVDFNPLKVGSYRLIGYENRVLATQDFADDKKDAGEIGAGHTVTALYELTPPAKEIFSKDNASNYVVNELRNPKNAESFTVKLRYKEPAATDSKLIEHAVTDTGKDFPNATEDFKFASSVAAFGMILRDSKYRGNATYNALLEWAEAGKGKDASGYRKEFCDIVRKARDLTK